ncbi:MAG: zinc ribbon domain-containing protein [Defluviitaleaceae bacterium]|nr:zinc ribbon domain-containing protein [Defluviitaleaceae bacterium]
MENEIFCQSCGMPMTEENLHGKNKDGSKNEDYCCYCFPNGEFTNPNETLEQMIESCIPFIIEAGEAPDEDSARKMCQEYMPNLKRWKAL